MSSEPGLFDAFRKAAGTALTMFQSRLELATIELTIARRHLLKSAGIGLVAILFLVVGMVTLSVFAVVLLWGRAGPWGLAAMGGIYLLLGAILILVLKKQVTAQPRLMHETNAELKRDAVVLRGAPAATEPH